MRSESDKVRLTSIVEERGGGYFAAYFACDVEWLRAPVVMTDRLVEKVTTFRMTASNSDDVLCYGSFAGRLQENI